MDILENSDNLWEDITLANMANILKIYFSADKGKFYIDYMMVFYFF
jgi:hypothetical protein